METGNRFKEFRALAVPLEGSNLIEASAGTGKTYSIAILVLRMILEKDFSIKEILMVTYTKAAVAELEERIRLFIRNAYRVSNNELIGDSTITTLVDRAIETKGSKEINRLLKDAVLYLDETAVLTIHSFCQQTLNEFAFETNQLFGAELVQDTSNIIDAEVNQYWRKHITSVPVELLSVIGERLSRRDIAAVVKGHLDGKPYHEYDPSINQIPGLSFYNQVMANYAVFAAEYEDLFSALLHQVEVNRDPLRSICAGNRYAKKSLMDLVDNPAAFLDFIVSKRDSGYITELFSDLLEQFDDCEKLNDAKSGEIQKCLDQVYYAAITEVTAGVKRYKLQNNVLSFDDLIGNLYLALVTKDNPKLEHALRKKYKAVFIDEFQDTDRKQYEIFNRAFGKETVLFYIGDPKQSIYAWRKADIATYFKAYNDTDICYGMNENYRSSAAFIEAMNQFFQPVPGFDTFHFAAGEQAITYIPVNSPEGNSKGWLNKDGAPAVPISINTQPNKESIADAVAAQVGDLLSGTGYTIFKNKKGRNCKPSDIGILVRSNKEAAIIKNNLARYGIPAVTIGDAKVLESDDAVSVLYILEAMLDITRSNINRALLSVFTGYTVEHILNLNDETAIELFRKYKLNWDEDGIYTALLNFIADMGVQQMLLQRNLENGERIITNLYQLVELLYKIQTTKKLSPQELRDWLKRGIERNDAEGDEYEQRMENDEEAVKIVTIHKSKGLEYNIVLAPYLDFAERKNDVFCNYRNVLGEYINIKKDQLTPEQTTIYLQQTEQENRRLLYVAITRAVYKCFIYKNNYYKNSTLAFFINALLNANPSTISREEPPSLPESYYYKRNDPGHTQLSNEPVRFNLLQKNWTRMSYTMLAAEMDKAPKKLSAIHPGNYDHFIFIQLAKGNKTGNMLHYIFENLNFTHSEKWPTVITAAIKRFSPTHAADYEPGLTEMLTQVLQATIHLGSLSFRLAEIGYDQRIHEFEFDFPVKLFQPAQLVNLPGENIPISIKERYDLEGIMNGKLDMLFRHDDKFFVLDWKSTYLGGRVEDYSPAALDQAMNENNYHLQYLIYTLATKKYLESRLPAFDYEKDFGGVLYLFVRGMRQHSGNGIFTFKPTLEQVDALDELLTEERVPVI